MPGVGGGIRPRRRGLQRRQRALPSQRRGLRRVQKGLRNGERGLRRIQRTLRNREREVSAAFREVCETGRKVSRAFREVSGIGSYLSGDGGKGNPRHPSPEEDSLSAGVWVAYWLSCRRCQDRAVVISYHWPPILAGTILFPYGLVLLALPRKACCRKCGRCFQTPGMEVR